MNFAAFHAFDDNTLLIARCCLKAECEKIKNNLGRFIRQKSIELVRIAFPEIEQEKLAAKIKKLDESARQDFFMHPDNDGKQY